MTPKMYSADLLTAVPVTSTPKPKKERSEKQIAAFEKAKATRERKREELESLQTAIAAKAEEDARIAGEAAAALVAKKELAKEKRRAAKEARLGQVTPSVSSSEAPQLVEATASAPRRVKKPRVLDPDEPPKWFQQYIHSVKSEKAAIAKEPTPKRQLKREAESEAQEMWKEPQTRDRVNAEANDQMSRMYSTIFSGRRMF